MSEKQYIHGLAAADKVMRDLPAAVEHKVLQKSTRAGGNVWRKALRGVAPRGTGKQSKASQKYGRLFENISTKVLRKAKKKGLRGVRVSTGNAFWGYLLEFGTRFIPAQPWFRPTIERTRAAAEKALRNETGKSIEAEAKKLARKHRIR